ncbi:hypothetical protein BDFB_007695 [Asbolus verrucosus]|uniref:Dynein regulatory complex subunit 2 n=1 Tax=Asbolus verrucosus TaxID=1661398 RepID=A0A482W1A5_ASBVE|nr:hypothetical protein BDFB_007695 [Asbolus verrucosus]
MIPKPKLTPEERRELRKQKKLENKLQREEKKRQVKRDSLAREIKYGELTYRMYEKDWKKMLIKMALPEVRQELELAWYNFERVIDCKDFTISLLMDEIKDAEDQHMYNFRGHLENVHNLIQLFNDRLAEFKKEYNLGMQQLQVTWDNETESIKDMTNENTNYVKTMLFKLEMARKEQERRTRAEYYARIDEEEVRHDMLLQKLKANMEKNYQNIFSNMKDFIDDHNKHLKDRKKKFSEAKAEDDVMQNLITQQFRHMKRSYDTIRLLRRKFNDTKLVEGRKLHDLQVQRQYFAHSFRSLKAKLADDRKTDFVRLAKIGEGSAKAFDRLERLEKKGEMILRLTGICRRLETQKEKILPFPSIPVKIRKKKEEYIRNKKQTIQKNADIKEVKEEMEMFWQRVGQIYSVHYRLKKEKYFLQEENMLIIDMYNDYCDKLEYSPIIKHKKMCVNKIDGNQEMEKYQKMKLPQLEVLEVDEKRNKRR